MSLFPCPEDILVKEKTTHAAATTDMPENDEEDDCPPFCPCACCGVQMMRTCHCLQIKTPVQFAVFHPAPEKLSVNDVYRPIWQPPQLS